jgi:hypothetical protein
VCFFFGNARRQPNDGLHSSAAVLEGTPSKFKEPPKEPRQNGTTCHNEQTFCPARKKQLPVQFRRAYIANSHHNHNVDTYVSGGMI